MEYRPYGKDGPMVSRLGFGVMRLPARKKDDWGSVNFTRSVEVLRAAMKAGVNLLDTHHGYHHGKSEIAIGRALKGWKGQRIYIQTKTPWYRDEPIEYFERLLDEALKKLGVDCIDYYFHHSLDLATWKKKGKKFIRFTDRAMKRGLIRHRGASVHDAPHSLKPIIDSGEFSALLMSYNWMNPKLRDTIAYAASKGIGITVMNPVGGGSLAAPTKEIMGLLPGAKSAPEIALRYVLATPGVTAALSGMNTLEQVAENTRVASRKTPMTAAQDKRMRERLSRIHAEASKFCTQCGYCMPCKHGVRIPDNFQLYNQAKYFGLVDFAKKRYEGLSSRKEGDASAAACKRCGECMPRCPLKVPIIEQLHEADALLG
jgi:hypothetical protein